MLRQVVAMPEDERRAATRRPAEGPTGEAPAPDALRELLAARQLLGNDREAIRQGVFRPSHNLPTRSLAEQVMHACLSLCNAAMEACQYVCAAWSYCASKDGLGWLLTPTIRRGSVSALRTTSNAHPHPVEHS